MSERIRVLLADDHRLVRAGFELILGAEHDLEVVGEAENGAEAVQRTAELAPDVVCMDVQMPVLDGIEATRRIVGGATGGVRVLMLTTFHDDEAVRASLQAGASGFVLKNSPPETLVEAIRVVHRGDALLDPQVTRSVIAAAAAGGTLTSGSRAGAETTDAVRAPATAPRASQARAPELERLTEREREVLLLLAEGLSNAEIAGRMFVSDATIKTHVSNLLAKLGVHDRLHAVIYAYEHGVIEPGAAADAGEGAAGR